MRRVNDLSGAVLLGAIGLVVGLLLGVVVGAAARRRAPVQCTSTLRLEPAGPGVWTLACEGGR